MIYDKTVMEQQKGKRDYWESVIQVVTFYIALFDFK